MSKEQQYIWRRTCDSLPQPVPYMAWMPVPVWVYTTDKEILRAHYHGDGRFTEPDLYMVQIRGVLAWTTMEPENPVWKKTKSALPARCDLLQGYSELCWIKDEDGKMQRSRYSFKKECFVDHADAGCIFYLQDAPYRRVRLWTEYMPQEPDKNLFENL